MGVSLSACPLVQPGTRESWSIAVRMVLCVGAGYAAGMVITLLLIYILHKGG